MQRAHKVGLVAAVVGTALAFVTTSCGGAGEPSATPNPTASATTQLDGKETEDLDRSTFSNSTEVDNTWFPLTPGTQLTYTGSSLVDEERLDHRVVFTVTDLVKEVDGVRSVVIHELDFTEDVLNEAELAFFAQADDGTVWHLGQYPEEYEDGKIADAPAWISGQEEAKAGIAMKADPQLGTPSYSQGWGPAVDWKDRARASKTGEETCVPAGCYSDVLVTEEFVLSEPDAFQLKYYAPGVGVVRVGWAGSNEEEKEELELVSATQLNPAELAKVRSDALAMEKRAYEVSPDVYGTTEPMQQG